MAQIINTNLQSLNAQRNLSSSQSSLSVSMQRLSSGLRVNSAKDDAAGLAIAERMNAQVRGMNVAVRNANDGISLAQTAEGALSKVGDSLQRMRELAVQARNATNTTSDLDSIGKEYAQLGQEIGRVIGGTTFNGKAILGADAGTQTFQIGANTSANDSVDVVTNNMTNDATITAVTGGVIDNASTPDSLKTVIDNIDAALIHMLAERFRCTKAVGVLKATHGLPPADPAREQQQIARLRQLAKDAHLDPDFAEKFLNFVVREVIRHHEQIAASNGVTKAG